jgi:hypothetical protein
MRRSITTLAPALLAAATALTTLLPAPALATGKKLTMFGLTADQHLVRFREDKARSNKDIGAISNLSNDVTLLGIDFRPANGFLYALGNNGGIYTIDLTTAQATFRVQAMLNGAPFAPTGTSFGVDFNPTVDLLRVISNTGQNVRINVETGVVMADADLNAGTPPVTATGVTGAGYTNNDLDAATGTTLFDINTVTDQVVIQLPPNNGVLTPTGRLGVDASGDVGFDIWSDVEAGRTVAVRAFATITTDVTRLYEVDVLSGKAEDRGRFRTGQSVIGLAIPLN